MKKELIMIALCSFLMSATVWGAGQGAHASSFAGQWTNKDFKTRNITRVHIQLSGDKIMVHEWGRCHPTECNWGETTGTLKGKTLFVRWDQKFAIRTQELTLLLDGTLQVTTHTHYVDKSGRKDSVLKDIFVNGLIHDWSEPSSSWRILGGG